MDMNQQSESPAAAGVVAPFSEKRIGKFRGSYLLVTESLELLNQDKEVVWFPVLATIANLIVVGVCITVILIFVLQSGLNSDQMDATMQQHRVLSNGIVYILLFVFYLIGAFITAFFQAGLVTIIHARINGQNLGFKEGMANAKHHSGKILVWSLFAATIGVVLQIVAERGRFLGRFISNILGTAWNIVTLFIVPVLVLENLPVKDSIARSGHIFKETWGETLIMNFSTGLFFGGIIILEVIAYFATFFFGSVSALIASSIIFFVLLVATCVLSSTLSAIYKVVLYEYAAYKKLPASFTPGLILGAVKNQDK